MLADIHVQCMFQLSVGRVTANIVTDTRLILHQHSTDSRPIPYLHSTTTQSTLNQQIYTVGCVSATPTYQPKAGKLFYSRP